MKYLKFKSQYNKYPSTKVENHIAICGYEEIAKKLNEQLKYNNKKGENSFSPFYIGL